MKNLTQILILAAFIGCPGTLRAQKVEMEQFDSGNQQFGSNSIYANVYYPNTIDTSMYVIDKKVFEIKPSYPGVSSKIFRAFPIPSSDFIIIESDMTNTTLRYKIYGSEGVLLKEDNLTGTETLINIDYDAKQTYLLKITSENRVLEAFCIFKKN